jgi:hypothetical protein
METETQLDFAIQFEKFLLELAKIPPHPRRRGRD